MTGKVSVLLTTEGTYPYHQGGVSTWCDILVREMKDVDYTIYSVTSNPFILQSFQLPADTQYINVPLWGTEEPCEHLDMPFSLVYMKKKRTTTKVIKEQFLPLFKQLIAEIVFPQKNPQYFGEILYQFYLYFQEYEYKESFKSEEIWKAYKEFIIHYTKEVEPTINQPDIYSLIQSLGWIYRFLNIVNTTVPKSDVTHSSAAAFCGIPCVISKIENKTPFLLSEHGVYMREQYLSLSKRNLPLFLKTFLVRFIQSITTLNYHYADQISPVCHYNTRWEIRFGAPQNNIKVIHNGVNSHYFIQSPETTNKDHLTVVSIARIDPIKDILTLIKAAEMVKKVIPNVKFIIYGSVSVQAYYEECLKLRSSLKLVNTFIFAGHTNDMVSAYHSGDCIALSSISEAFPYSVIEAMMTGKPVVATDVGGVREAIADSGYLVTPRKPEEMAKALTKILQDENLRKSLGRKARERALAYFTLDKVLDHHYQTYSYLATTVIEKQQSIQLLDVKKKVVSKKILQKYQIEKAYSLFFNEIYLKAIEQFRLAINIDPSAPYVPVILSEIANCYQKIGQYGNARNELDKVKTLCEIQNWANV